MTEPEVILTTQEAGDILDNLSDPLFELSQSIPDESARTCPYCRRRTASLGNCEGCGAPPV